MTLLRTGIAIALYSLLLTACGGSSGGDPVTESTPGQNTSIVNPQTPTPSGLDRLLGRITMTHSFNGSETVFVDSAVFDATSYNNERTVLTAVATTHRGIIGCTELAAGYDFLCISYFYEEASTEIAGQSFFTFDLNTATTGSGLFEYCFDAELAEGVCATEIVNSPDGTVDVTINPITTASAVAMKSALTDYEVISYKQADDAQFGAIGMDDNSLSASDALALEQQIQKIRSALTQ